MWEFPAPIITPQITRNSDLDYSAQAAPFVPGEFWYLSAEDFFGDGKCVEGLREAGVRAGLGDGFEDLGAGQTDVLGRTEELPLLRFQLRGGKGRNGADHTLAMSYSGAVPDVAVQVVDATIFQDLVKTASTLGETIFFKGETDINFLRLKMVLTISWNLSSYSTAILLPMAILFVIGLLLFMVPIDEIQPRLSGGICCWLQRLCCAPGYRTTCRISATLALWIIFSLRCKRSCSLALSST